MSAKLSDVSELRGTPCREHVAVSNGVTVSNVQIAPATTRTVHGNRSSIALHDTVLKRYRVAADLSRAATRFARISDTVPIRINTKTLQT